MKYFISIDMEGIWGTSHFGEAKDRIEKLMSQELNHVVEVLSDIDSQAKVVVCDSHAFGTNIIPENLSVNVELIRGFPRKFYMMEGLDDTFDAVLFIGYHAPVGDEKGVMNHTYSSSSFFEIRINGKRVGESEINAIFASLFEVPVIFISGDSALYEFSAKFFPETEFLITKKSIGHNAVKILERDRVFVERVKSIERAFEKLKNKKFRTFIENNQEFQPPYTLDIVLKDTLRADLVSIFPESERIDGRTVRYKSQDFKNIYRFIVSSSIIAWQANNIR